MQSIQSMVSSGLAMSQHSAKPVVQQESVSPEVAALFDQLFGELKAIFPAWATSGADESQIKKTWLKGFLDNGISTKAQLSHGLRKARQWGKPFLPSIGQFCQWCTPTPEDFGMPTHAVAFREAISKNRFPETEEFSHPAVYVAMRATGSWAFKNQDAASVEKLFNRNYDIAVRRVINGEDLSLEIPLALPETVFVKASKETAALRLAEMRKNLKRGNAA